MDGAGIHNTAFTNTEKSDQVNSSLELEINDGGVLHTTDVNLNTTGQLSQTESAGLPVPSVKHKRKMAYKTDRWYILSLSIFENIMFGGIFYGWPAMVFVLKSEGYFSYLCPHETKNGTDILVTPETNGEEVTQRCDAQDAQLSLLFTIGIFCLQGTGLIGGFIYDRYGTRFMRILINILIFVGFLLLSISTPETSWLLFPSAICLSVGGIEILILTFQIGNLFGNRKSTVITAINGVFDSSTVVMFLIKVGYEAGLNISIALYVLTGATFVMLIQTFLLLPKGHIPWPLPPDYRPRNYKKLTTEEALMKTIAYENGVIKNGDHLNGSVKKEIEVQPEDFQAIVQRRIEDTKHKEYPTLAACICSPSFFGLCFWTSLLGLRNTYFLASFNNWIDNLVDSNQDDVSFYTGIFAAFQCSGLLFAPLCGLVFDRNKKQRKGDVSPYADLKDSILPVWIVCTTFLVFSAMVLVPVLPFHYATFVFQVILRAFFYATLATIVGIIFPLDYIGTLYGLAGLVAATMSLLQYPIFRIVQGVFNNDQVPINIIFLFVVVVTYAFPVYLTLNVKRKETALKKPRKTEVNLAA